MNVFATIMLFAWVPISIGIAYRYRASIAAAVLILGAMMFLPQLTEVKLPGLVAFDKTSVASLWCVIGLAFARPELRRRLRMSAPLALLLVLNIVSMLGSAFTNTDLFVVGGRVFPGFDANDASMMVQQAILTQLFPFLIGHVVYRSRDEVRDLLVVVAYAGVVYSLPMILELFLSPQLHRWVYGEHQHEFQQAMRAGGYRPMVFMAHGLAVALFAVASFVAALTLHRLGVSRKRLSSGKLAVYLGIIVVACKSAGALIFACIAAPAVLLKRKRLSLALGFTFSLCTLLYPVLLHFDLVPKEHLTDLAREYLNDERADSLRFRFLNEALCFERGLSRPAFGWGGADRGSIFDPTNGRTLSVRDGHWVITFGEFGYVGYAAQFGLLVIPVFVAWSRRREYTKRVDITIVDSLALLVGIHAIDLIPNGLFSSLPYFFSGVLLGVATGVARPVAERRRAT